MKAPAAFQRGSFIPSGPFVEQVSPWRDLFAALSAASEELRGRGNPTAVTCATDLYEGVMRYLAVPTRMVTKRGRIDFVPGGSSSGMLICVDPRLPPGTYYEGLPLPDDPAEAMAEANRRLEARAVKA